MVMAVSAAELRRERRGGQFGLRRPAMMGSHPWCGPLAAGFVGRWDVVEYFGIWHRDRILSFLAVLSLLCAVMRICPWTGGGGVRVLCRAGVNDGVVGG